MHIPSHPKDFEKYQYISHHQRALTFFSVLSFTGVIYSSTRYFTTEPLLYIFLPFLAFLIITYVISTLAHGLGKPFDAHAHHDLVEQWKPKKLPSVDVFLPIFGEHIDILRNTWSGVSSVQEHYKGNITVYVLDDGASDTAKGMAAEFGFKYLVRDNRGHFKKAGNLQHGFQNSNSEFIAIFDADFRPRADFLNELLPYFYADKKLGIVQSPQYFDVHNRQNWIERGAGAVQEYFYRAVQQNRQSLNGAICVGSNAIYRRKALAANGGTTLIEHSEDVHTGFDLRKHGWGLKYIPIILAKGVCPNDLRGFFRQQYRWCKGSMSLLGSKKFWETDLALKSRICYMSGFLYYIQTGVLSIILPLIPLSLLFVFPEQARLLNYLPLLPALLYNLILFPMWHKSKYSAGGVYSIKLVYGWAHLFSIVDTLLNKNLEWNPSGSTHSNSGHYNAFRAFVLIYGVGSGLLWVVSSAFHMATWSFWDFLPLLLTGLVYLTANLRIAGTAYRREDFQDDLTPEKNVLNPVSY